MTYDCCSLPIMEGNEMTEKDLEIQELRRQRDLLLQENAELREKQRWIAVEERLPEGDKDVIVYVPAFNNPKTASFIDVGYYYPIANSWMCKGIYDPTHWMPLPTPPEVRE